MCGRFTLRSPMQILVRQFRLDVATPLRPRYNIAPTQDVAVVRATEAGQRELVMMRWGLVPSWADDLAIGNRMINARGETLAEKPSFRSAFKKRRCLVLADGYYEWKQVTKPKQPYLFHFEDDRPFALAGLWESWSKSGSPIETCTIITTSPSPLSAAIHDRMPVILDDAAIDRWLDPQITDAAEITQLIRPFEDPAFVIDPVSTLVNSPTHEDPRCVEPTQLP
jgi:putative SOS response-associated peptidase YedK